MKRFGFTTLAIAALLVMTGTARAEKGTKIFDIYGSYLKQSGDAYETSSSDGLTTFGAGGGLMQFVHENIGIGVGTEYRRAEWGAAVSSEFKIGPRAALFFNPDWRARTTHPFVGGAWFYTKHTSELGSTEFSSTTSTLAISGGLLNMFTESVGLHVKCTYNMDTLTPDEGDSVDGTRLVFGAGFNVVLR